MKRVTTAIVFILIAIALCLTGYAVSLNKLNSINQTLGKAAYVSKIEDKEGTIDAAKEVEDEWSKSSVILFTLLIHTDMDEIDAKINMLSFFAQKENFEEFEKICNESIVISNHLIDSQKASFENIFWLKLSLKVFMFKF